VIGADYLEERHRLAHDDLPLGSWSPTRLTLATTNVSVN
jgi:hypothetical protein